MFTVKNRKVSKFKFVLWGMVLTALFLSLISLSEDTPINTKFSISSSSDKSPSSLPPRPDNTFGLRSDTINRKQKKEEIYRRPFSKSSTIQSNEEASKSPAITYHNTYYQKPSQNFSSFLSRFKFDFILPGKKDIKNICEALHKNLFENENVTIPFSELMDKNTNLKNAYEELQCPSLVKTDGEPKKTVLSQNQYFGGSQTSTVTKKFETKKIEEIKEIPSTQEAPKDIKAEQAPLDPKNLNILISSCNQNGATSDKNFYVWLLKSLDLREAYLILYSPTAVFLVYKFTDPIAFADDTQTFLQLATIPITEQTQDETKECLIHTLNLKIEEKKVSSSSPLEYTI